MQPILPLKIFFFTDTNFLLQFFPIRYSIFIIIFGRIIGLPPRCRKNMFISFIPTSQQHFSSMRFIFFNGCITNQSYIIMHIKAKQWSTFAPGFCHNKVIKCVMMRNYEIFFNIHKLICCNSFQFMEFLSQNFQAFLEKKNRELLRTSSSFKIYIS